MTKAKGRARQEARLKDMAEMPSDVLVTPDGETISDEIAYPTWSCIDGMDAQVVVRSERLVQGGQLTDFAVMLQVRAAGTDEAWADVQRVDCTHGTVHVDEYKSNGTKKKNKDVIPVACRKDLDKAFTWALEYIWDIERRTIGWT